MRHPTDPRIQRDNKDHDPYSTYSMGGGTIATEDVDRVVHYNNNIFAVLFTDGGGIIANVHRPNGVNLHAYGIRWVLSIHDVDYSVVAAMAGVA